MLLNTGGGWRRRSVRTNIKVDIDIDTYHLRLVVTVRLRVQVPTVGGRDGEC